MKPKENISLIGFMGSGKTTIGKLLAERTGYLFIDLDRIIELSESKTINEIFTCSGEEYFREIESKIIKKVYFNNKCVFACGGGVILRGENMKLIRKNSEVDGISFEEAKEKIIDGVPVKKTGNVDDFGSLALWLLSPLSSYITGQTISVDGGAVRGAMG